MCSSTMSNPRRTARSAACRKAETTRAMPASSRAVGTGPSGQKGMADGATVCQAPSASLSALPPSHGRCEDALRPA